MDESEDERDALDPVVETGADTLTVLVLVFALVFAELAVLLLVLLLLLLEVVVVGEERREGEEDEVVVCAACA